MKVPENVEVRRARPAWVQSNVELVESTRISELCLSAGRSTIRAKILSPRIGVHMLASLPIFTDPWWHKPEWLTGVSTALLVLFGLIDYLQKRRERHLRICKAEDFDPNEIVGGFRAKAFSEYLTASQDNEIWLALLAGDSIGLRGRPGIGKSHSAAFHIRKLGLSAHAGKNRILWWLRQRMSDLGIPGLSTSGNWYVIRPPLQVLQIANQLCVRKRRYVLLLDDLNDYVRNDEGAAVLDLISTIRSQSEDLVVVSTLRSTAPEDESVDAISKIFGRWKWVDLPDWQLEQGINLAQLCGGGVERWDGTPLSVKQPSSEMRKKYDSLQDSSAKAILRCLLLFRNCGLSSVTRAVLKNVCATDIFNVLPSEFETALARVNRFGFLKTGTLFVEAYEPYLDAVHDWAPTLPGDYLVVRNLLVREHCIPELMTIATRWYGQERFGEAEWICRKCIELAPRAASLHCWLGSILHKSGDLNGAEHAYWAAVKLDSHYLRARSFLARIWFKLGRIEDAEKEYRSLIRAAPQMFEAILGLGILLLKKGDFAGAEHEFQEAIHIRPGSARARCFLGETFFRLDQFEKAGRSYGEAVELDPKLFEARIGYARLLLANKHYKAAAREAQQAILLTPHSAWAHSLLGDAFRGLQKFPDAEASYRTALSLDPECVDHKFALGILLLEADDYVAACTVFSSIVNADPTSWRGYSFLGEAYAYLRKFDEAEESYHRASQINPMMSEPLTGLGMTLLKKGDFAGAEVAFIKALTLKNDSSWVYARLGDAFRKQKKFDEAEKMYSQALSVDPEMLRLRYKHGVSYLHSGKINRAELVFRDVLQFDPENIEAYSGLSEALIRQRKISELKIVQERMVELHPKQAAVYIRPGMSALGCADWNTAEYFFRKAIAIEPEHARAHQHLGEALRCLRLFDEAASIVRRAIHLNPQMSKAHYLLGKILMEKGDLRKAEAALRESIKIKSTFADAHVLLGEVLERRGQHKEADKEHKAAVDLNRKEADAEKQT